MMVGLWMATLLGSCSEDLYDGDGIAFDSALLDGLPDTVLSVQPARDLAAEQALAEGIIGSVTSIDSGGGAFSQTCSCRRRHSSPEGVPANVVLAHQLQLRVFIAL